MNELILRASAKVASLRDRMVSRVADVYDREEGASLVEQIIITVVIAIAAIAIMYGITQALMSRGSDVSNCITNADPIKNKGCS